MEISALLNLAHDLTAKGYAGLAGLVVGGGLFILATGKLSKAAWAMFQEYVAMERSKAHEMCEQFQKQSTETMDLLRGNLSANRDDSERYFSVLDRNTKAIEGLAASVRERDDKCSKCADQIRDIHAWLGRS